MLTYTRPNLMKRLLQRFPSFISTSQSTPARPSAEAIIDLPTEATNVEPFFWMGMQSILLDGYDCR